MTINERYALIGAGKIENFFPTDRSTATGQDMSQKAVTRDLSNSMVPVQLQRIRQNLGSWREAIGEAERAYYPHRVAMQRLYIDTVLNGHVWSCMERRRDLTLLRKYEFVQGETASETATDEYRKKLWFNDFLTYALDADAFGYSLISLGDVVSSEIQDVRLVRRWNISPDRKNVVSMPYMLSGKRFLDNPYRLWHVYVPTASENGVSDCGYGYLYRAAMYEVMLRNLFGYNGDFVELYAQPYRVGKTTKTEGPERDLFTAAVRDMGSNGWAITDPMDEIAFLETALGGTGWQGYDNLEQRCEKKISKLILGHADALDSTPGKLGGGQDGEESPVAVALAAKQAKDGARIEALVNNALLPRLAEMGIGLPANMRFRFKMDEEAAQQRKKEDESNEKTAQIAQAMKSAGFKMSKDYFEERTGIATEEIEEQPEITPQTEDDEMSDTDKEVVSQIQNKLKALYK